MKKRCFIIFTLSMIIKFVGAQQSSLNVDIARLEFRARQVVPPAPEAAELGKYGNVPVSLFTGTPTVSVPLYELKGQVLSFPVHLSYNTSGFKPEDQATWVGLGWSLHAGGVISRAVKGNPDIDLNYFTSGTLTLPNGTDVFAYQDFLKDIKTARRETEPDFYYFNFAGHTGKFTVLPDKSIVKKQRDNLAIRYFYPNVFEVVDESGTVYTFSNAEQTRMVLMDDVEQDASEIRSYFYNSSWYLSQISSADGTEKIILSYLTTAEHALTEHITYNESVTNSDIITYSDPIRWEKPISGFTASPPFIYSTRKFLQKVSLLRNGEEVAYITFTSAAERQDTDFPEDQLLKSIKVFARHQQVDKLVKQYNFGYNYFQHSANVITKKRLHLDTISEIATGPATIDPPPYLFEYNSMDFMPEKYTTSLDHWGYYNAAGNNSLVPTVKFSNGEYYGNGANREPSFYGSIAGALSKITYPTGGYTAFEYEQHEARRSDGTTRPIGGIRIKEITNYSYINNKVSVKRYDYMLEDGTSSGRSDDYFPKYDNVSYYHRYPPPIISEGNEEQRITHYTVSSNSIYGLGFIQGSHIGYSKVTEYQYDFVSDQPLGKTVYNYHIGTFRQEDDDIGNGDLEKQSVFDNSGKLLSELTNTYNYTNLQNVDGTRIKLKAFQDSKYQWCKRIEQDDMPSYTAYNLWDIPENCITKRTYYTIFFADNYTVRSQQKFLTQQVEKKYDQLNGAYLVNTRKMTYNSAAHTFPTQIEDYTTGNEIIVTHKKYAGDYTGVNDDTAGILTLLNNNMPGTEIERVQYRQNADGTNKRLINGQVTFYDLFLHPDRIFRFESAMPVATWLASSWETGDFVMDTHYKPLASFKYSNGLLTAQSKDKDAIQSYLWDYTYPYPVATIHNAANTQVTYSSFENDVAAVGGWVLTSCTFDTTVTYTGIRSLYMGPSGNISRLLLTPLNKPSIVSYWSRTGPLTLTQNNTTTTDVAFTGPERNGWTFYLHRLPAGTSQVKLEAAHAVIDEAKWYPTDAQVTTYTYEPLVGITSRTTPDELTSYYEYDGLNRLVNIRDEKKNIRQHIDYNYGPGVAMTPAAQTLFYNKWVSANFTKRDCTVGTPSVETYVIPYGKYVSAVSQADADVQAQADISANGQHYADTNGKCWFYNVEVSQRIIKNDCAPDIGNFYTYLVAARKWRSETSQAAADQLAQDDIATNGQAVANKYGSCACSGEGKKFISNVCETGFKNYLSSEYIHGQYKCTYNYSFSDGSVSQTYTTYSSTPCSNL